MVQEVLGRAHPGPIPPPADELKISFLIENYGTYMELNQGPYRIAAESFNESSQVLRRQELMSPFADGTYLAGYTKDNITENLAVWVRELDHSTLRDAIKELTTCFEQYMFESVYRVNTLVRTWQCLASDYSVISQHEYLHSKIALVRATLVRLPNEVITEWGI